MLHLPSALVGSLTAGGGFLLIHRELSHRSRLSNKWVLREYAEAQWRDFRSDRSIEDSKKNFAVASAEYSLDSMDLASKWNKGLEALRGLLSSKR
mmetsp:Transcript_9838/g.23019  ORF Transcript_9838/g.23019 Transcript_9838/m.23019 type:complete len:95 (+) Transcript_9838:205-489(+)